MYKSYYINVTIALLWMPHLMLGMDHKVIALMKKLRIAITSDSQDDISRIMIDDRNQLVLNACMSLAVRENNLNLAQSLLNLKAELNCLDYFHPYWTILCQAALDGHIEMCRLLLRNGASPDCRADRPNSTGRTPLMCACEGGHLCIAQLLKEYHTDVNAFDRDGKTALYLAMQEGHADVADFLRTVDARMDEEQYYHLIHAIKKLDDHEMFIFFKKIFDSIDIECDIPNPFYNQTRQGFF